MPLVVGTASGGPASPGAPGWVVASYAVAGLALLVFIGLLVAWLAFRIGD